MEELLREDGINNLIRRYDVNFKGLNRLNIKPSTDSAFLLDWSQSSEHYVSAIFRLSFADTYGTRASIFAAGCCAECQFSVTMSSEHNMLGTAEIMEYRSTGSVVLAALFAGMVRQCSANDVGK